MVCSNKTDKNKRIPKRYRPLQCRKMKRKTPFAVWTSARLSVCLLLWGCHVADIKTADEAANNQIQARAYNDSGKILTLQGHFDKAIKNFTKAIELDPNYAEAYNDRGAPYRITPAHCKLIPITQKHTINGLWLTGWRANLTRPLPISQAPSK
jgi:tetratricopeptide (TPR) repeat protein